MSPELHEARSPVPHTTAWARMAAVVLLVLGLAFLAAGAWLAAEGLGKTEPSGGVREALVGLGAISIAIGALHIWAASLIWIGRDRGRTLGLAIGIIGTVLASIAAWPTLRDTFAPRPGSAGAVVALLLLPVPYVIVLVGLLIERRRLAGGAGRNR
jgi:hypothetical protein